MRSPLNKPQSLLYHFLCKSLKKSLPWLCLIAGHRPSFQSNAFPGGRIANRDQGSLGSFVSFQVWSPHTLWSSAHLCGSPWLANLLGNRHFPLHLGSALYHRKEGTALFSYYSIGTQCGTPRGTWLIPELTDETWDSWWKSWQVRNGTIYSRSLLQAWLQTGVKFFPGSFPFQIHINRRLETLVLRLFLRCSPAC